MTKHYVHFKGTIQDGGGYVPPTDVDVWLPEEPVSKLSLVSVMEEPVETTLARFRTKKFFVKVSVTVTFKGTVSVLKLDIS